MSPLRLGSALLGCISLLAVAACGERPQPSSADAGGPVAQLSIDTAPALPAGGFCALDLVNGALAGELSSVLGDVGFRGWVVDASKSTDGEAALVLVGEQRHVAAVSRAVERPDVAAALGADSARMSGFNQVVALDGLSAGEYRVHVASGGVECDTGKRIAVGG